MSDNNERESARSDNPDNGGKNTNRESKSNERGNTEHEAKKSNRLAKLKENIVSSKMGIPKVLRRIKSTASTLPGKKKKKIGDDTDLEINRNQRPDTTDEASIDGGGVAIPGSSNGKNDRNKRQSEKERVEDLRTKYSPNLRAVSTVNRGETEDQDETHSNKSEGSPQITEYDRQVILKFDMNEFNKVQDPPGLNALFKKKSENEKKGRRIPANINAYEIQSYTESDLKKDEQNTSGKLY
ncbi:hypothetical protein AX774_g718 [Zancudomyces culisetae]|uniref:Uncharacterized protein n=1 Tax=Zancudomyces culisetae TaxID=1213189 RepID=A0A1R1PXU1_ZANCU|nr:hypothetical protein AX774_g3213 [Zancudomyces culisetae]OMH85737.1 hypothetical protein AX774_g718 [Zancudomyces culisetae]|eukprot:OMH83286.1 hypothetical protein AX774_g3213 [Zancudomyces culisetae]